MMSSAKQLLDACEALVWDGTDLEYTNLEVLASEFSGVNENLSEACQQANNVLIELDAAIMDIIENVKKNVRSFVEATELNEQKTYDMLAKINEQSLNILSKLGK